MIENFDLIVGAKRQVTIPVNLFRRLALKQGDQLRVTIQGEAILLEPMVTLPRRMVSESLLSEMNARRGEKSDDLTLAQFIAKRREGKTSQPATKEAPARNVPSSPRAGRARTTQGSAERA